jgi:YD repeat-containing protein
MKRLPFLALLLLCALPCFPQELVYTSNSFGMLLQRIEPYRRDQADWIVGIKKTGQGEVRRLYSRGKEVRRWEVSWSADGKQKTEREVAAGLLAARRVYGAEGELLQEDEYSGGALARKSLFTYRGNRLLKVRVVKPDGSLSYAEQYVYGTSGALREVRRTEAGGGTRLSAYVVGPAGLSEERNASGDVLFVARYDARGKLASREQRRGEQVLSREDYTYQPDSDRRQASVERFPPQNEVVERRYDGEGRLTSETRRTAGSLTEESTWSRDAEGRTVGRSRRTAAGLETWKYLVDAGGRTLREDYLRRGMRERVTIFGEGNLRTEDFYREDGVFLRVFYDGDKRLREEVFEGGKLVRERHYD